MSKLSKDAFAIMAKCEETQKEYGISVDPRGNDTYAFCWGFKIKEGQAKREGYDSKRVRGRIMLDEAFNGCPYCGSKQFYICSRCGKVSCYHGEEYVTCPSCKASAPVGAAREVELSGGSL